MAGLLAMSALPEGNKVEDLFGLLTLAQVSIGITEGTACGVLSQEHQNAGLAAAARRHIVAFDERMLAIVRDGMKIEIEGFTMPKIVEIHQLMPSGQHLSGFAVADARGIFRQVAFLWNRIESRKQGQALVSDQRHNMAATLDGPQLERQTTPQGVFGRDHFGSWQMDTLSQLIQLQAH